jgi:hypothetical protein
LPSQSLSPSESGGDGSDDEEEKGSDGGDESDDEEEDSEGEEAAKEEEESSDEGFEYNPRTVVSPIEVLGPPTHPRRCKEDHFKAFHDAIELK